MAGTALNIATAKSRQLGQRSSLGMSRIYASISIVVSVFALSIPAVAIRADGQQVRIKELIGQLGAENFSQRQAAERELRKIGSPAIDPLRAAFEDSSPEVRGRAKQLVEKIHFGPIHRGFDKFQKIADSEIDIEEGMWLISRIVDHTVERKTITDQLNDLAAQVRKKLGADVDPTKADPRKVLAAIHQVMFVDNKFDGAPIETYDQPQNSSISYVLEKRRGLPIILSHIMVAVGDRLGIPLVGLPVGGRYMVKYDGQRAPKDFPTEDVIINPFETGATMTPAEFQAKWGLGGAQVTLPKTNRSILERMVRNLQSDCEVVSDLDRAEHAGRIMNTLLEPLP